MADTNTVLVTGTWVAASTRAIGQSGRTLVELKLRVTRPGKKGEGETAETVPIIVWDGRLGDALLDLAPGTPLTVVGRISARDWTAPGGQTKTFLEVVGERVTIGVETLGVGGEPREATVQAAAPSRPASVRTASAPADRDVPF